MFKILSDDDAEKIHQASLEILERTGMIVEHDAYLEILKNAGAVVDAARRVVHLPRDLVINSIKKAPENFIEYGRTSEHNLAIEKGKVYAQTFDRLSEHSGPNNGRTQTRFKIGPGKLCCVS